MSNDILDIYEKKYYNMKMKLKFKLEELWDIKRNRVNRLPRF